MMRPQYGCGSHLGHVTWAIFINIHFSLEPLCESLQLAKQFWRRSLKMVDNDDAYTTSSPCEPYSSVELKMVDGAD